MLTSFDQQVITYAETRHEPSSNVYARITLLSQRLMYYPRDPAKKLELLEQVKKHDNILDLVGTNLPILSR